MEKNISDLAVLMRQVFQSVTQSSGQSGLFNQYAESDRDLDIAAAAEIRRNNLLSYIAGFVTVPRILVLGEAPGYDGCRFSGVPFTSEYELLNHDFWKNRPILQSSVRAGGHTERSARVVWELMGPVMERVFMWNVVPHHPWKRSVRPRRKFNNRTPTLPERERFTSVLAQLVELLQPLCVLPFGKHALNATREILPQVLTIALQHPSPRHGGEAIFRKQMPDVIAQLRRLELL